MSQRDVSPESTAHIAPGRGVTVYAFSAGVRRNMWVLAVGNALVPVGLGVDLVWPEHGPGVLGPAGFAAVMALLLVCAVSAVMTAAVLAVSSAGYVREEGYRKIRRMGLALLASYHAMALISLTALLFLPWGGGILLVIGAWALSLGLLNLFLVRSELARWRETHDLLSRFLDDPAVPSDGG